jgi:hypothetical protein
MNLFLKTQTRLSFGVSNSHSASYGPTPTVPQTDRLGPISPPRHRNLWSGRGRDDLWQVFQFCVQIGRSWQAWWRQKRQKWHPNMWYQWTKLSMLGIIFSEVYEPSHLGEKHRKIEDEKNQTNSWPRTKKNTKRHIQIIQKKKHEKRNVCLLVIGYQINSQHRKLTENKSAVTIICVDYQLQN